MLRKYHGRLPTVSLIQVTDLASNAKREAAVIKNVAPGTATVIFPWLSPSQSVRARLLELPPARTLLGLDLLFVFVDVHGLVV